MTNIIVKNKAISILQDHNVSFAGLFGSRANGTAKKDSDYDFLVEFNPEKKYTLLDIVSLKQDLEDVLSSSVDVVTTKALHSYLTKSVYSNFRELYDHRT